MTKKYFSLYRFFLVLIIMCFAGTLAAQVSRVKTVLDSLSVKEIPELNRKVSISISQIQVGDFIRAIANEAGLNVSIPNDLKRNVNNNFKNVAAKDILAYLCRDNDLELGVVGNILKISKKAEPPVKEKEIIVVFDKLMGEFMMDLSKDNLGKVVKKLTEVSGKNVILSPGLMEQNVSGFYRSKTLKGILDNFAHSNSLRVKEQGHGVYILEKKFSANISKFKNFKNKGNKSFSVGNIRNVSVSSRNGIAANVSGESLEKLFRLVASKVGLRYHILSKIDQKVNLNVKGLDVEGFLYNIFKGSKYTYKLQDGICYVGERRLKELKGCKLVKLRYRSVDSLARLVPRATMMGLEVKEFAELNSLFVCGDSDKVLEFSRLISELDQKVPVVLIDVMIVEISNKVDLSVGIEAAISAESKNTEGGLAPGGEKGINLQVNGNSVNSMFNKMGFGSLGRLSPNFYMKLKALDESGKANIKSTPRLSTINGHEARLKIGKKEYYREETNNYWGSQNPQLSTQKTYKPVEANLEVIIKPFVSGDGSVNMKISVEQSEFTSRIIEDAPPGMVTRKFESMIRVKDRETILLGGLEQNSSTKSSRGVPVLGRIPVLKWLFGYNSRVKEKSRLNIIIRPSIIN